MTSRFDLRIPFYNDPPAPGSGAPNPAPNPAPPAPKPAVLTGTSDFEIPTELKGKESFNQEDVNKLMAHNKRGLRDANQQMVQRLETLQQQENLTKQQRDDLQTEIDQLKAQSQTKEQQAQAEYTKLQTKYTKDLKEVTDKSTAWEGRYKSKTKSDDLLKAAIGHKAFNPNQIVQILLPQTDVVEEVKQGQPTGNFISQVKFTGLDKDQKPIDLTLSPEDAVKAMTEMPEQYGNLFRNDANGGVGGMPATSPAAKDLDLGTMTHADYVKNRPKILEKMGQRG